MDQVTTMTNVTSIKRTYWLYYNEQVLTSVRMHKKATRDEVLTKALSNHEAIPGLSYPDPPSIFEYKIKNADIRFYENEY